MKLEEAIGRLRTCAQWNIDQKQVALERTDPRPQPHTVKRIKGEIDKLEEARTVAAEFIEILRDREWTGQL